MTHSINYYIQLSDDISKTIDNMSKKELEELAEEALYYRSRRYGQCVKTDFQELLFKELSNENLVALAHGLLAKAI